MTTVGLSTRGVKLCCAVAYADTHSRNLATRLDRMHGVVRSCLTLTHSQSRF